MNHSVIFQEQRCRGCTSCIKRCPTQAIRVRRGKAIVLPERCIDCGQCIPVCPHKAIQMRSDPLTALDGFRCKVALPDPALFAQFRRLDHIDRVLAALGEVGFDRVYEVARGARILSDYALTSPKPEDNLPVLSSYCPAVQRLIRLRFPKLIEQISPTVTPMELSARLARREAAEATGIPPEEIGVFAIVPCISLVSAAHYPDGGAAPVVDGAIAIRDIYLGLLSPMRRVGASGAHSRADMIGLRWAYCGGESAAHLDRRHVVVDGIDNVIHMLSEIEDGRVPDADFVELSACTQGCLGGCFNVENPFSARMRLRELMRTLPPPSPCRVPDGETQEMIRLPGPLKPLGNLALAKDADAAMEKLISVQETLKGLPGLDCGSCGAPSCRALAEDVAMDRAALSDCIFKVRERAQSLAGDRSADDFLPAPFRRGDPSA